MRTKNGEKEKDQMNKHPMRKEKVLSKTRKLNALTMEAWDTTLKSVLAPKILKRLCKQH